MRSSDAASCGDPALDPSGHRTRAEPVGEVLTGVFGRASVGFDRGDPGGRAEAVADGGSEQPDAAVEIEVVGARVEQGAVDRVLHGRGEDLGGSTMNLPEPAVVEPELALTDALADDRGLLLDRR